MSDVLSNDLIAQFAKAAVGNDETKPDSTLRGTITRVVYKDTEQTELEYVNVKIDGSDLETPVSAGSFSVGEFAEEDRVEVAVKNHEVTITGNTTNPALGIATKGALRSEISQTANQIRLEVADTANKLESSITLTANEIRSEVSSGLSGLDSKITQTADEINQKISKGDAEFTELKQTIDGWEFVDENGSIYISDGTISWAKLSGDAQQKVNNAQSTANSANATAGDAFTVAQNANNAVNDITTLAWNDGALVTQIDGSKIAADSIYSNAIHLGGAMTVYKSLTSYDAGGYLGYDSGFNSAAGIGVRDATQKSQMVCTEQAARISYGNPNSDIYFTQLVASQNGYAFVGGSHAVMLALGGDNIISLFDHGDYKAFRPHTDANKVSEPLYLGNSSNKWAAVYAVNGTIQTSDRNQKHDIEDLPDKYVMLFDNLQPKRFKMNEGTSGRYHVGYIAQEVEDAMVLAGIDSVEFGGFVRDKDSEGNEVCMLRYGEFDAIYAAKIKQLETRLIALEKGEQ